MLAYMLCYFYVQYCAKETSPLAVYIILPTWDRLVTVSLYLIIDCDIYEPASTIMYTLIL